MKNDFTCGDWFAWFPVRCSDGTLAWLSTVERRLVLHHFGGDFYYVRKPQA